jgi:hypothetical protein
MPEYDEYESFLLREKVGKVLEKISDDYCTIRSFDDSVRDRITDIIKEKHCEKVTPDMVDEKLVLMELMNCYVFDA